MASPLTRLVLKRPGNTRIVAARSFATSRHPSSTLSTSQRRAHKLHNRDSSFSALALLPPSSSQHQYYYHNIHSFHTSSSIAMASDEGYGSFLDQANQDTGSAQASSNAPKKTASATASKNDVHAAIAKVDTYYVSDSDEPFEPVSFDWDGGDSLDESSFEQLLSADGDVTSLTPKEFDPKGKYKAVLEAVGEAGDGQIFIFNVDFGGTRSEYYVVSITRNQGQVQGLKALAIES